MCYLNGGANSIQIGLRQRLPGVRRGQHIMQMLAQLAGALCNARTRGVAELSQGRGNGRLDELRQFSKAHEVAVGRQVLDRPIERPFIQRIHEIEGRVASAPLERIGVITQRSLASRGFMR